MSINVRRFCDKAATFYERVSGITREEDDFKNDQMAWIKLGAATFVGAYMLKEHALKMAATLIVTNMYLKHANQIIYETEDSFKKLCDVDKVIVTAILIAETVYFGTAMASICLTFYVVSTLNRAMPYIFMQALRVAVVLLSLDKPPNGQPVQRSD